MKILSIILFFAFCASMGSSSSSSSLAQQQEPDYDYSRFLQYDDDSRTGDIAIVDESDLTSGPAYPTGTPLGYWVQDKSVWVDGSVVGFAAGFYYVKWDDKPGRLEGYDSHLAGDRLTLDALKGGANRANDDPPDGQTTLGYVQGWEKGTPVRYQQRDGTYRNGKVKDFNVKSNEYTVQFSDGKVEYYDDYQILAMVQTAEAHQRSILRISIVGAIAGLVLLIVLWICIRRCCCKKKTQAAAAAAKATTDPELGLNEEDDDDDAQEEETNDKDLPAIS